MKLKIGHIGIRIKIENYMVRISVLCRLKFLVKRTHIQRLSNKGLDRANMDMIMIQVQILTTYGANF